MRTDKKLLQILLKGLINEKSFGHGLCLLSLMLSEEGVISEEEEDRIDEILIENKPRNKRTVYGRYSHWWVPGNKPLRINFLKKLIKKY